MASIERLCRDAAALELPKSSYILSYPFLVDYFGNIDAIGVEDVIIGAHMVYGWMQTIVTVDGWLDGIKMAAEALGRARQGERLSDDDLENMKFVVNHSVVGASKLLHFAAPEHYAIWDSRVYRYIYQDRPYQHRLNTVPAYVRYLQLCKELIADPEFARVQGAVEAQLPYSVTPMRAVELVMYASVE